QAWKQALELYVKTPELIYASIALIITVFGIAWAFWRQISKERIETLKQQVSFLKDQLGHAKEEQERIATELETLRPLVSQQETIINNLRFMPALPRGQVELLSTTNTTVVSSITNLAQANNALGMTLTVTGEGYRLELPALTKKSST